MRQILVAAACIGALIANSPGYAAAKCRESGVAVAPFIGPADMRAIDRAVMMLPAVRRGQVHLSMGAVQPRNIETKSVPTAVKKVLPQYTGYQAFRSGHDLVIVKPGSRRLVYILPLRGSPSYNCP